jgi:hypothetical protein
MYSSGLQLDGATAKPRGLSRPTSHRCRDYLQIESPPIGSSDGDSARSIVYRYSLPNLPKFLSFFSCFASTQSNARGVSLSQLLPPRRAALRRRPCSIRQNQTSNPRNTLSRSSFDQTREGKLNCPHQVTQCWSSMILRSTAKCRADPVQRILLPPFCSKRRRGARAVP